MASGAANLSIVHPLSDGNNPVIVIVLVGGSSRSGRSVSIVLYGSGGRGSWANRGGVAVAVAVAEASGGKMRNELGSGALV